MISSDAEGDARIGASDDANHFDASDDEASNESNHVDVSDDDDQPDDGSSVQSPENPENPENPDNPENPEDRPSPETVLDEQVVALPGLGIEDEISHDDRQNPPIATPVVSSRASTRSLPAEDDGHEGHEPIQDHDVPPQRSIPTTARPNAMSSRSNIDTADDFADEEPGLPRPAARKSAFNAWTSAEPYTIGPFVLLLIEEFCRQYDLTETAAALQRELQDLEVQLPDSELWVEMYGHCRSILGNKKHSSPQASGTTIEKLVEFCVSPLARRAVFSLDMASAHSPVNFCASPKRGTPSGSSAFSLLVAYNQIRSPIVRPSQRPSATDGRSVSQPDSEQGLNPEDDEVRDQPLHGVSHTASTTSLASPAEKSQPHPSPSMRNASNSIKKKKKRKTRQQRSSSVISILSHGSPHRDHGYGSYQVAAAQLVPGTYGEPVLVDVHKTDLKRDLTSTRLLEKELRDVRIEKISTEPKKTIQKRLGFRTLTAAEEIERKKLQDPYASELVMEKYGFSKRQDCALCQFPFLMYNLPHKVSFKCVMDVYDHWNYVPPDRETASKYKAPLCYDAVHVCRMCAQIVFEHAKQPESHQLLEPAPRPLSRKHKKAKSLANLHQEKPEEEVSFCSDPYALPPLLGDDVFEQPEALTRYYNTRRPRVGGLRGDDLHDGDLRGGMSEFPAKAIIYSQQIESSRFMSSKEWDIINPEKSSTRHILEATLRR